MGRVTEQVKETIEKHELLAPGSRVVVGVSGGADSLTLLHVLYHLQDHFGVDLHITHLDHMLRGRQAQEDAAFVRGVADTLGLPITIGRRDIRARKRGASLEQAARRERYDFFFETAHEIGADRIAVGHHADDQVETVLMRLIRGTGPEGLTGMSPCRRTAEGFLIIRPLFELTRDDIQNFIRENGLQVRKDPSNQDREYLRNRIRHDLLPRLEADYNSSIRRLIFRTSRLLAGDMELLDGLTESKFEELSTSHPDFPVSIELEGFSAVPTALKRRVLRRALLELKGNLKNIYREHIAEVLDLVDQGEVGSRLDLPGGIYVYLDYTTFHLTKDPPPFVDRDFCFRLSVPITAFLPAPRLEIEACIFDQIRTERLTSRFETTAQLCARLKADCLMRECLDWERVLELGLPLYIRNRRPGDSFQPLGMQGTKKLKDFFIDRRVPQYRRDSIPLLVAGGDRILAVLGWGVNHTVRITDQTSLILVITAKGDVHLGRCS